MLGNGTASYWVTLFTRFGCYQSIQWALLAQTSPIEMGHLLLDCSEGCSHPSRWRITNRSVEDSRIHSGWNPVDMQCVQVRPFKRTAFIE